MTGKEYFMKCKQGSKLSLEIAVTKKARNKGKNQKPRFEGKVREEMYNVSFDYFVLYVETLDIYIFWNAKENRKNHYGVIAEDVLNAMEDNNEVVKGVQYRAWKVEKVMITNRENLEEFIKGLK